MYKVMKFYPRGFNLKQYWDDKYAREHIAGKNIDEFAKQDFWPLLEANIQLDKRYLDAGCGVGGWILFLREKGYNVEGIDSAARTVRAMTEYDPDIKVKIANITAIPYADASFDGLLAIGVLEYAEDKLPQAFMEINRVLKPGGLFFMELPHANFLRRLIYIPFKNIEKAIRRWQRRSTTFANYLFDRTEIISLLKKNNFIIAAVEPHELPDVESHYGLYIDFKILRGREPYKMNFLGRLVKSVTNYLSPWIASTGMVIVAKKRP